MSAGHPSITLHALSFAWPDGSLVLDRLDATFPSGRTGLIGLNGAGKTTLVRILAGELAPTSGRVEVPGVVRHVRQDLTHAGPAADPATTVADVLGVGAEVAALARIDAGAAERSDFDLLDGRWDAPDRARATLGTLGLDRLGLDRAAHSLSGGEVTLVALAAAVLADPDVLLLDEPTNNLDRSGRERLGTWLAGWSGPVVVVSHDRELLAHVDQIAELHPPGQTASGSALRIFGGAFDAYQEVLAVEAEAAERAVRTAEADLRRQRREQAEMRIKLDRRQRTAKAAQRDGGIPKIVAGGLKRAAEVSAGKLADRHAAEVQRAGQRLAGAAERVRDDDRIRIDLPDTAVPASRDVLITDDLVLRNGLPVELHLRGPERVALVGPNGVGKTTLVDTLTGAIAPRSGAVHVKVPLRVLPQRMRLLDDELSVLAAVDAYARDAGTTEPAGLPGTRAAASRPGEQATGSRGAESRDTGSQAAGSRGTGLRDINTLRAELARFLLTGDTVQRPVRTLSGGERFRATLAALLLAAPAPQLLILDEPTNNLDLDSVAQLVAALDAYRGALLVISHDEPFLAELALDRRVELGAAGESAEI